MFIDDIKSSDEDTGEKCGGDDENDKTNDKEEWEEQ